MSLDINSAARILIKIPCRLAALPPCPALPSNDLIGRDTDHIQMPTINILEALKAADHPI
ncbi:hypothetical protein PCANC_05949 [Puccinia coronata f. sp. avenae]|uniref:Uncharacterized protein n=1 Tax=Puccinia coronata f. sp. avenae TaxID=200324 RepID=A0A2N5VY10_9BASI|nr:hypothetical protein PCANC_05949 [Puccinia coronata f. sp. avenae]